MRILTAADYRVVPWRNGGGTTKELVIEHAGSADRFLFRASIADVRTSGPFSRFDGYDRHIMLVEGEGMEIDCGAHGKLALDRASVPRSFSGDWDVTGTLANGPVRDFNWIVDRARARSSLEMRVVTGSETVRVQPRTTCVVHVLEGALEAARTGDTLVADADFLIAPHGEARLVIARALRG